MAARPLRAEECRLTQPLSGRTPSHSLRSDTLRSQGLPLRGVRDVHPISGDPGWLGVDSSKMAFSRPAHRWLAR